MSDIQKAVEAAARAVRQRRFGRHVMSDAYDPNIEPTWNELDDARSAITAALPHLASAQPQPSEYDLLRAVTRASEEASAAALDECEAIARDEARMWGKEVGSSALAAADRIAALKRGPISDGAMYAEESRRRDPQGYDRTLAQIVDELKRGPIAEENGE